MLTPRQPVPALQVPTLSHGAYDLHAERPERFSLLVFYRGLHCPICHKYLLELGRLLPEFTRRGVGVIALSSDTAERALRQQEAEREIREDPLVRDLLERFASARIVPGSIRLL